MGFATLRQRAERRCSAAAKGLAVLKRRFGQLKEIVDWQPWLMSGDLNFGCQRMAANALL
jgi:hypothetical protein